MTHMMRADYDQTAEAEVEHLAEQCDTLLRRRLRTALKQASAELGWGMWDHAVSDALKLDTSPPLKSE
jgi:hypothetical protein